jgi:hypothetical protein
MYNNGIAMHNIVHHSVHDQRLTITLLICILPELSAIVLIYAYDMTHFLCLFIIFALQTSINYTGSKIG